MIKLIPIESIKNDMILAEDLFNQEGILYLNKGITLSLSHIETLRSINIHYVYIKLISDEHILNDSDVRRIKIINREYNHTLMAYKRIFHDVLQGGKPVISDVKQAIMPLVSEVINNNDILKMMRSIETTHEYTFKHSVDVSLFSAMLGKWLGYDDEMIRDVSISGLMHDIGKSRTPVDILDKPSRLTIEEFNIIKNHARDSYEIMKYVDGVNENILMGILQHHEKIDGKGYPLGIDNPKIHPFAKIIAVADVFDALTSDRIYRSKLSSFQVADLLSEMSTSHLDVSIVQIFIRHIAHFFVGNRVKLNTGEVGEVVMVNRYAVTRPLVKCGSEYIDLSTNYGIQIVDVLPDQRFN